MQANSAVPTRDRCSHPVLITVLLPVPHHILTVVTAPGRITETSYEPMAGRVTPPSIDRRCFACDPSGDLYTRADQPYTRDPLNPIRGRGAPHSDRLSAFRRRPGVGVGSRYSEGRLCGEKRTPKRTPEYSLNSSDPEALSQLSESRHFAGFQRETRASVPADAEGLGVVEPPAAASAQAGVGA